MHVKIAANMAVGFSDLSAKDMIEDFLKDKLGIEADISVGALGTGLFDSNNTYKDTRNGAQELKRIPVDKIICRIAKSPSASVGGFFVDSVKIFCYTCNKLEF